MLSRRLLRTKVVKGVYAHLQCCGGDIAAAEKSLVASIDKAYELYYLLLDLAPAIVRYAEERQQIGLNKKLPTYEELHPNRKFVENQAAARIAASKAVAEFCRKHALGWPAGSEVVRNIYTALLDEDFYRNYMSSPSRSLREDAALLEDIYMNMLEMNELLESVLEEQSALWIDDLGYVLTMVARTVASMRQSHEDVKLMPKFKSDEDLDFAKKLLRCSVSRFGEYCELTGRFASNWDVERIAFMDNVIISTALAEIENFPSIPVKVSMNEYIDIAKAYSTPHSHTFINGVLDKLVSELAAEGRIDKSGKGLL